MPAEPALGSDPRDRALAWRVASALLSGAGVLLLAVLAFSAKSYVRTHAADVAGEILAPVGESVAKLADLPPRMTRIEEISRERGDLLRLSATHDTQVDIAISRLTGLAETQQKQLDRQQTQLDRLEQFLRGRDRE